MAGTKIYIKDDTLDNDKSLVQILVQKRDLEIMIQKLTPNASVWIEPANDITTIEFFYVLSGKIKVTDENEENILGEGSSFSVQGLTNNVLIDVYEETRLLYCTNRGMYDELNSFINRMDTIMDYINQNDHYTKQHCTHVGYLSALLYRELEGSTGEDYQNIAIASIIIDVGKCYLPEAILMKEGKYTEEEYQEMKKHTNHGYNIVKPLYGEKIANIVLNHHEFLDGSGYNGLKGEQISLVNRIIAVADAFDAMTFKRTYARQYSYLDAVMELYKLDNKYDRKVTSKLLDLISNQTINPNVEMLKFLKS